MALQSPINPPSTKTVNTSAQQGLPYAPKHFIGAVEDEWQLYSDHSSDYVLGAPIGFGASSIVYAAVYHPRSSNPSSPPPPPIPCALKVLDLDSLPPRSLSLLQRETTLMSLSKHPNVLRVRGSWMDGHKLYIAMRLMNKGSAADVMRYGWPGGMEEDVIKCILRQALQGLNYLHINGFIHRDVKAANLLIDDDGTVLLGDLGVAANLAEDSSFAHLHTTKSHTLTTATTALARPPNQPQTQSPMDSSGESSSNASKRVVLFDNTIPVLPRPKIGKRKSFVGTPCWMAPELIQGRQYDSSADIWSFGITALELTQGRPPRSRDTPQRVLLKTIQDAPPTLDREGGTYKYSRAFKEMVESCLVKDPTKRPTAEQLLQTPFFKSSKKKSYLVGAILKDLPPLTQRQERRAAASGQTHRSIDSWDFATTVHSPTTSIYCRRVLEGLDLDRGGVELEADAEGAVFEMEREGSHASLPSRKHSRAVSWAEEPNVEEQSEQEAEAGPSSLAVSPPDLDFVGTNRSPSSSSSSSPTRSSPPSSTENEAPPVTSQPKPTTTNSAAQARPPARSTPPLSAKPIPVLSSSPNSWSSPSQSSGLWSKIKTATNLKRPPSRGGGAVNNNNEKQNGEMSEYKEKERDKEKGGMGSRLARKAGSGRISLTRTTGRTAQAVGLVQGM